MKPKAKLTPKQERFIQEYLIDLNASAAARRAGYSSRSADDIGQQLLGKTHIASAIARAKAQRADETKVNAKLILELLHEIVIRDPAELYDEDRKMKPIDKWPLHWRRMLTGLKKGEFRFDNRQKAIELLGRHVGVRAFKDTLENRGEIKILVEYVDR